MRRGLSETEASAMIVSGFVEPITKQLLVEDAVEMKGLIDSIPLHAVGVVLVKRFVHAT